MITLIRQHPVHPLFVGLAEDGRFEDANSDDARSSAAVYAYEQGLAVGDSVWIGWGKLPPVDDAYDFEIEHYEQWIVTRTSRNTSRLPTMRLA